MPATESISSPLLQKREAAVMLRVTERTVCNYIRAGLLPTVQIGGREMIHRDVLDRICREGMRS